MRRFPILLLAGLIAISGHSAIGCIWVPGTTQEGKRKMVTGAKAAQRLQPYLRKNPAHEGERLLRQFQGATNFEERVSYGAGLIYAGKYDEAIKLLVALEAEKPGVYYTAANLGTAYELAGNNLDALKWINESIARNPNSHQGTEWVHVKILEAKVAAATIPNYFNLHTILDLKPPLKLTESTIISTGNIPLPAKEIRTAIQYQLQERLEFVKSTDPVVASLLFDYAVLEAALGTLESAKSLLVLAKEFETSPGRIDSLIAQYDRIIRRALIWFWFKVILAISAPIALLVYFYKRGWFGLGRRSAKRT